MTFSLGMASRTPTVPSRSSESTVHGPSASGVSSPPPADRAGAGGILAGGDSSEIAAAAAAHVSSSSQKLGMAQAGHS